MTPAAALSQAALDVTPAYAATETHAGTEGDPIPADEWADITGLKTLEIVKVDLKEAQTYNGEDQTLFPADFKVTITNTPEGGSAKHYELTGDDMFTIEPTADGGLTLAAGGGVTFKNAKDDYGVTVTLARSGTPVTKGDTFSVGEYPIAKEDIKLAAAQVGISKASDLTNATKKLNTAKVKGTALGDLVVAAYPKVGDNYDGDTDTYKNVGTAEVTLTMAETPAAANYKLVGDTGSGVTKDADIVAEETYSLVFGTLAASPFGKPVANPTDEASMEFKVSSLPGLAVTAAFPGDTKVVGAISSTSYEMTWKQGSKVVDAETPANLLPGVYTGTAQVGGEKGKPAEGALTLTVKGDLSKIGTDESGVTATMGGVAVHSNGTSDGVSKAFVVKKADTTEGIAANIAKALTVTFTSGAGTQVVKGTDLDVKVNTTESTGTAIISAAPANVDIYSSSFNLKYAFGKELPKAELKVEDGALPWYGDTGYVLDSLIKFVDEDGVELKGEALAALEDQYTVAATYVGADGQVTPVEGDSLVDVNDYTLTVAPKGNYAGDPQTFKVSVQPVQVTEKNAKASWPGLQGTDEKPWMTYAGEDATPLPRYTVTLKNPISGDSGSETVTPVVETKDTPATDSVVSYAGNEGVGTATATTTFRGNFKGSLSDTFEIRQASLAGSNVTVAGQTQLASDFDGTVLNPTVKIGGVALEEGVDFEVVEGSVAKVGANTNGGSDYTFSVKGIGNYTGTNTNGTFATSNQSINDEWDFAVEEGTYLYDLGDEVKAKVVVTEKPAQGATEGTLVGKFDTDQTNYTLTYENDTNAGTATVTVTGVGAYAGSKTLTYEIAPLEISADSEADVVLDVPEGGFVYAPGIKAEPAIVVAKSSVTPVNEAYAGDAIPLKEIVDQIGFKWANNDKAGTAQAIVYGKGGNIVGEYAEDFEIAKADISKATVESVAVAPGADLADAVKVTLGDAVLAAGTDYTAAAAEGATVPGTVAATVTGTGNYTGEVKKDVDVLYDVAKADVAVADAVYNGKAQTPKVEVSYTADGKKVVVDPKAYDVKVDGNATDAGAYKVTVAGDKAAGWTGSAEKTFTIAKAQGPKAATVTYTAAGTPVVTVPGLTEGKDFKTAENPAQKKIAVTYIGNYTGSTTVDYVPAAKPVTPAPAKPAAGKTGWVGSGNDWAYYENGQAVKGGWELIGGEWYHFEKSGKMTNTKWFQDADGTWYMLNQSHKGEYGAMLKGWQKDGGDWYYFAKSGAMQSGWAKVDGEWYLLNTSHDGTFGKMLTGWQQVGGKWYYMDASGAMASNEWVGRYWVNGSGVWTATR